MRRKLIKQGGGGTTVYLPKKWVDDRGLKSGDEVDITEEGDRVIIGTATMPGKVMSIEADLTGMDRESIIETLTAMYESGYDEMKLTISSPTAKDFKLNKEIKIPDLLVEQIPRFHGLAIVSQGPNHYTIRDISQQSEKDFDVILRRVFFLMLEFNEYIHRGLEDGHDLNQGKYIYNNITRFISFCLRLLNKKHVPHAQKYNYYEVVTSLDWIAEYHMFLSDDLNENKLSEQGKNFVKRIGDLFREFHDFSYKVEKKKLVELKSKIANLERELLQIDLSHKEFSMLYRFSTVIDVIDRDLKCLVSLKLLQDQNLP